MEKSVLDTYEPSARGCLHHDELEHSPSGMFKKYSQQGCLFECRLQKAINKLGCVPFDYFHTEAQLADNTPLCARDSVADFQLEMTSQEALLPDDSCHCPENCAGYLYQMSVDTAMVNPYKECLGKEMQLHAFSR